MVPPRPESKDSEFDQSVLCQLEGGQAIARVAYDFDMRVNGFAIIPAK